MCYSFYKLIDQLGSYRDELWQQGSDRLGNSRTNIFNDRNDPRNDIFACGNNAVGKVADKLMDVCFFVRKTCDEIFKGGFYRLYRALDRCRRFLGGCTRNAEVRLDNVDSLIYVVKV